jgi:PhnB protein
LFFYAKIKVKETGGTMANVNLDAYLFFGGKAKEAMEFYKSIFGGELNISTVGEFPGDMPNKEEMKDMVMHAMLTGGDIRLMASDSPKASEKMAKVELSLSGDDAAKLQKYWDELSEGGTVKSELKKEDWGDMFGQLTDKYGIDWMVNISSGASQAA